MQAAVGDRLHVHSKSVGDPDRVAEIVEVRGERGAPPYLVRFPDGHEVDAMCAIDALGIAPMFGQPIEISNSDETMHNVHALGKANRGFNFPQPIKGMKSRQTFPTPEVMVTVKCDVHPWMNAYIGVVNHPYFAVSANGGTFDLKNVPAGTYTIEAWHEKLGTQTQSVTLGAKETKPVSFTS